jgi:hypothetical protein
MPRAVESETLLGEPAGASAKLGGGMCSVTGSLRQPRTSPGRGAARPSSGAIAGERLSPDTKLSSIARGIWPREHAPHACSTLTQILREALEPPAISSPSFTGSLIMTRRQRATQSNHVSHAR